MLIYPQNSSNVDFPEIERKINKFWQENHFFQKSIDVRKNANAENFVFYDGPPFANGLPHYGHLLTGYVKDIVARFQTMKGKVVERRFGWDCHGLPAEMGAEKELGLSGRMQIMNFGVGKFNEHCKISVLKYTSNWQEYVTRQGRWVDFENDYKTMNMPYMESVLWGFKQLFNKGLIYESMRVMPYSWACETPLSNFETRLDNSYRERADKAITVKFTLKNSELGDGVFKMLAWTTTPWTLPSNLALAVGPGITYVILPLNGENLIIAKSSLQAYAKELGISEMNTNFRTVKGSELIGSIYEPLFPYFKDHENAFRVLGAGFVEEGGGTGIVHLAPGFGEDDQILCQENQIELVCPVDNSGKFTSEVPDFEGIMVFDAIDDIIKTLKSKGFWLKTEQYIHNYPHCWRTDTPLIYKAVPSWYVEVTKIKDRMVELNQQINWIPEHVKNGSFGKWLENARDWSISRNRFWGTPIPVWKSDNPNFPRIDVYGSVAELEADFGVKVTDLHKPFIDDLTRPNPDDPSGKSLMRRVEDVFDCWFESGSMPFAQQHYPFENKEKFEANFPADFIVEYSAQTRGWFYTLMVLQTAIFDKPPFLNCICHGVILDENGSKLSKRLQNYADPIDIFNEHGSDALRYLMCSSSVMRGLELLIDKEGRMIKDVARLALKPIWNAYNFFTLYANSDEIEAKFDLSSQNLLDSYIISKAKDAIEKIDRSLSDFDIASSYDALSNFFEVLNNWYIRRNRNRFWQKEKNADKTAAYDTLFSVLVLLMKASAPIIPFLAEEIFCGLNPKLKTSVHLCDFPNVLSIKTDVKLMETMDQAREICSHLLSIRNDENIRVRQPLSEAKVLGISINLSEHAEIIKDEVNVKNIVFSEEIGSEASFQLKINFKNLGKRLPGKIKELIAANQANQWVKNAQGKIEIAGETLNFDEFELVLKPNEGRAVSVLSSGAGLVMLNLEITKELENEGFARDLVRQLQQMRKDADLEIASKIKVTIGCSEIFQNSIKDFMFYIKDQVLATEITFKNDHSGHVKFNIESHEINISIEKDL